MQRMGIPLVRVVVVVVGVSIVPALQAQSEGAERWHCACLGAGRLGLLRGAGGTGDLTANMRARDGEADGVSEGAAEGEGREKV